MTYKAKRKRPGRTVKKHVASVAVKLVKKLGLVNKSLSLDGPYPVRDYPATPYELGYMT